MQHPDSRPTLVSLFLDRVAADGPKAALAVKRGGQYHWLSWNDLAADVRAMAGRLTASGLRPGERLVLASENRYEWIVCDLAVHLAGGVHVAVHCSLSGPQIAYQICDSGARLVVVSNAEQARKLAACAVDLPAGLRYFSFDAVDDATIGGPAIGGVAVERLAAAAGDAAESQPGGRSVASDLATILYTSGTTGEPKGVMLTHGNLTSNALSSLEAFCQGDDELRMSWLPLSHIYARTSDLYIWIASGSRMALAESRETLLADCAAVGPTFMNGVPYFYERVARHLQDQGQADRPGVLAALLGGNIRVCCSGGAALPLHVARFFADRGVPLLQGYGLTETSPVITTETPTAFRPGSVGQPIAGVEVRIAADGEVLCRGPNVMRGYWNKPAETAAVLRDGWFYTGDLGQLDDGFLRITGRKKELIVTAAGKNIAPAYLEGLLTEDPLIAQALVVGEGRNYLAALIVPDPEHLRAELVRRQIRAGSAAEALVHPDVRALFAECIRRRLAEVSRSEQVHAFALLERGFTIETGELTPTLKLRRGVVQQHFADRIEGLYAGG